MLLRQSARVAFSTLAVLALGLVPLVAQEPAPSAKGDAPAARRKGDPSRRVPPYFAQVGLTPDQREAIYKIRAQNQGKVEALQKQIEEIRSKELADCEKVLTEGQKKLLAERRKAGAEKRSAARSGN